MMMHCQERLHSRNARCAEPEVTPNKKFASWNEQIEKQYKAQLRQNKLKNKLEECKAEMKKMKRHASKASQNGRKRSSTRHRSTERIMVDNIGRSAGIVQSLCVSRNR